MRVLFFCILMLNYLASFSQGSYTPVNNPQAIKWLKVPSSIKIPVGDTVLGTNDLTPGDLKLRVIDGDSSLYAWINSRWFKIGGASPSDISNINYRLDTISGRLTSLFYRDGDSLKLVNQNGLTFSAYAPIGGGGGGGGGGISRVIGTRGLSNIDDSTLQVSDSLYNEIYWKLTDVFQKPGTDSVFVTTPAGNSFRYRNQLGVNVDTVNISVYSGALHDPNIAQTTSLGGALVGSTGISSAVAIGYVAGVNANTGQFPIFLGPFAGNSAKKSTGLLAAGVQAGFNSDSCFNSNFIGRLAGQGSVKSYYSNFFGYGIGSSGSYESNFFGLNAGNGATNSYRSIYIGSLTGAANSNNSIFIGNRAALTSVSTKYSIFLGDSAGANSTNLLTGINSSNSIYIGRQAGFKDSTRNLSNDSSNILIGNYTRTGGFTNSVLIGSGHQGVFQRNNRHNQFKVSSLISDFQFRGVDYVFPSSQGAASTVLTNNGSGNLSWSPSTSSSSDSNFANADLTFTGDRYHNADGKSLTIDSLSGLILATTGVGKSTVFGQDDGSFVLQSSRVDGDTAVSEINAQTNGVLYGLSSRGADYRKQSGFIAHSRMDYESDYYKRGFSIAGDSVRLIINVFDSIGLDAGNVYAPRTSDTTNYLPMLMNRITGALVPCLTCEFGGGSGTSGISQVDAGLGLDVLNDSTLYLDTTNASVISRQRAASTYQPLNTSWLTTGNTGGTPRIGLTSNNSFRIITNNIERLVIDSNGLVGLNSIAPISTAGGFDISSGGLSLVIGANSNSSTRTNSTQKLGRVVSAHYTNAEEPIAMLQVNSNSGTSNLALGGGSGLTNAATQVDIYTASNTTTTTGSIRMSIINSGNVGIGTTSPQSNLDINGSLSTFYIAKTTTYTATAADHTIDCTGGGTFTITLPTAVGITGREYFVTNSGAGTITVATASSQTFTNVTSNPTSLTITGLGVVHVKSTGVNWIKLN